MEHVPSGKKFYYINTHLDHVGLTAQREGLKLIVERIGKINPEQYPMILTGDFNVTPGNPALDDLNNNEKRKTTCGKDRHPCLFQRVAETYFHCRIG